MITESTAPVYDKNKFKFYAKYVVVFFILTFFYVVFGIFLFFYLEDCLPAAKTDTRREQVRLFCLQLTRNEKNKNNFTDINTTNLSFRSESRFEKCKGMLGNFLDEAQTHEQINDCKFDRGKVAKWLEFTIATIHTIGYGNVVPYTKIGKIATIVYSLVGIPLVVILYTNIGNLLAGVVNVTIKSFEKKVFGFCKTHHLSMKTFLANLFLFLLTFAAAATVSHHHDLENLSWLDSFYFWWITLTTIGYGDRALHYSVYFEHHPYLVPLIILFILLGLALIAAMISSLLHVFSHREPNNNNSQKCCRVVNERDTYSSYNDVFVTQQSSETEDEQYLWELIGTTDSNEYRIKQSTL